MSHRTSLTRAAFAVALTAAAGACKDAPTQPPAREATPAHVAAMLSSTGLDFSHELGDIHTRFLPSFDDQKAADSLQVEMNVMSERLAAGDTQGVRDAIGRARGLLAPGVAHPVDLYAIGRTFDVLESYLP